MEEAIEKFGNMDADLVKDMFEGEPTSLSGYLEKSLMEDIRIIDEGKPGQLERIAIAQTVSDDDIAGDAAIVMDRPKPETFGSEWLKWWYEAEAKIKVLKAKALINELNRQL